MKRDFNSKHIILLMVAAIAATLMLSARSAAPSISLKQRKADYIFLEALRHKAIGNSDAYYELAEEAYCINPTDKYLAMEHATRQLLLRSSKPNESSGVIDSSLAIIKDYVVANPSDLTATALLARLSTHYGRNKKAVEAWKIASENNPDRIEVSLNYIDALSALTDSTARETALSLLNQLESREGINPDFAMRRMRLYDQQNNTEAIKAEAQRLLSSSPNDIPYLSFVGKLYLDLGDPDSALIYFNRAVEVDPGNGQALYNRAAFYNQIGDSTAYDSEVFRAMSQTDLDVEPKLEILRAYVVKLYQDSTQRQRIAQLFDKLVAMHPHVPEVRGLYADYLAATAQYAEAAEQKAYQLDLDPSDDKGWIVLSSLYLQTESHEKSEKTALKGSHYFPENVQLLELASAAALQQDKFADAKAYLRKAMEKVDSTDLEEISSISSQMGDIYYKTGDIDSMRVNYERALLYNNRNLSALNNYAYYLACNEIDLDQALAHIERVMDVRNDDPTSLDTYAWVLFKMKNFAKAREIIDKTLELSPTPSAELFEHAGDIYFMDGQPEQAIAFWQKALKLDPNNDLLKRKVKHKTFFYK